MATKAGDSSVYNANTNWENERKYLTGLANSGNSWATQQLEALNRAQAQYTQPVQTPVTSTPAATKPISGTAASTGQANTAPVTQPVAQPVVQTPQTPTSSGGAKYTYNGNTYTDYTEWVMAQTGATAEQVARAQALSGGSHAGTLAALRGQNMGGNAGILAQDKIEKELQGFYDRWLGVQDDPLAYLYGTSFEEALAANGGMDAIYRALQSNGYQGVNQGLTDAQYAEMLQRVTGGNTQGAADGYSLAYKLVNGINDAETEAYRAQGGYAGVVQRGPQQTTTYIDDDGNKQTGYVSGSVTGGGDTSYLDTLLQQLNTQYQQQLAANETEAAAATQRAILQLENQKNKLNQEYSGLYEQLYLNRRMAEKNLPQQLAAMGYNGGLTESALLGLNNEYQQNLRAGEIARLQGLDELEMAIAEAQLSGDISKAKAARELAGQYYNNYAQVIMALQEQANQERQWSYQQQLAAQEQQEAQRALLAENGWILLENGILPDASALGAMQLTEEQARALMATLGGGYTGMTYTGTQTGTPAPEAEEPAPDLGAYYNAINSTVGGMRIETEAQRQYIADYLAQMIVSGYLTEPGAAQILNNYGIR